MPLLCSDHMLRRILQMAPMSAVRGSLGAVSLNGHIWAIGGGEPGVSLETVEVYDPIVNAWMPGRHPDQPACDLVAGSALRVLVVMSKCVGRGEGEHGYHRKCAHACMAHCCPGRNCYLRHSVMTAPAESSN